MVSELRNLDVRDSVSGELLAPSLREQTMPGYPALWAAISAKLTDAPSDGNPYARQNGAWVIATGGGSGLADAPSNASTYGRQGGAWVTVAPSTHTHAQGEITNLTTDLGNKQAAHANLTAFAGLSLVADRLAYANGTGTLTLMTFTAAGRALVDDADAAAQRTTLGVGSMATRAVTISTSAPSGGADGDFWAVIT